MTCFPLTDLGMSLSVPYNHEEGLLQALEPYYWAIAEVYTAPPPDVAESLKPFRADPRRYHAELSRMQSYLADRGVSLSFTFNTPLSKAGRDRVVRFLEARLGMGHRVGATFRMLEDAAWVHGRLPEVEIASSLSSGILGLEQARAWVARAGARVIHPDKLLLRKRAALAQIRELGVRIKLIINNRCRVGSPYCEAHARCAELTKGRQETDLAITRACERGMERRPWTLAPLTLPPAHLWRLEGVLDLVKLDGRNWPTAWILAAVERTVFLRGATFYPWYAEPPDAFAVLAVCRGDCSAACSCAGSLYLYGAAARRGPRIHRQNRLVSPGQDADPRPGDGLAFLLADAPRLGFRADGLWREAEAEGIVVDLRRVPAVPPPGDPGLRAGSPAGAEARRWPLRFRLAGGKNAASAFRLTRRYQIQYLFAEQEAPPDLLANLGALGDAIAERDAALPPKRARRVSSGPVVDRVYVGGFCAEACRFCEAVHPGHRRAPPEPDPALVDPGESAELARLLARPPAAVSGRPRHLELVGENPAGRADLPALLEAAVGGGYERRTVQGPAGSLAVDGWAEALAGAGLTHAAIALYAAEARVHDALVDRPGAWADAMHAVARLRAAGVGVELSTVCVGPALRDLPELVARTAARRVYLYGLVSPERLPQDAATHPAELAERLAGWSDAQPGEGPPEIHLFALPLCVGWQVAAAYPGRVVARDALPELGRFSFALPCRNCGGRIACPGVAQWVLERYGAEWLSPLSRPASR